MGRRRHSAEEIAAMLQQADMMAKQGMLQSDIARTLGISVMTFHRWRRAHLMLPHEGQHQVVVEAPAVTPTATDATAARLSELQLENSRLRRLVTDLLLEKMKLEESIEQSTSTIGSVRTVEG